jgi:hypothetical protein
LSGSGFRCVKISGFGRTLILLKYLISAAPIPSEKKIEQEVGVARKNAKTNKRAALQALKRKKRYEKQLQQIDGTLSTIEMQREALGKTS